MLTLQDIEAAARVVYQQFQATPQYRWALSSQRLGTDCWIKHENHTPVGAFKIRGGLTYFDALKLIASGIKSKKDTAITAPALKPKIRCKLSRSLSATKPPTIVEAKAAMLIKNTAMSKSYYTIKL